MARLKSCPFKTEISTVSVIVGVQEPIAAEVVVYEKAGDEFAGGVGCEDVPLFQIPAIDLPPGTA